MTAGYISNETVEFVPVTDEHSSFVLRLYRQDDVRDLFTVPNRPESGEKWVDMLTGSGFDCFVVRLREEDVFIGTALVDFSTYRQIVEVGLALLSEYRAEGYGTETLRLLLHYVFEFTESHKARARIIAGNHRARELFEGFGFTQEGCLREHEFVSGEYRDMYQYGLLRREYEASDASDRS